MARLGNSPASTDQADRKTPATRKLVLVGFMGAGKSTAARLLSVRLGCNHVDADQELERALGEPIPVFFDREGESAFRRREAELVADLLDNGDDRVVALGGGAVVSEAVRSRLNDHVTIYLEVDPELAWRRSRGSDRPLARDRDRFVELFAQRRPIYEDVARAVVPSLRVDEVDFALGAAAALDSPGVGPEVRMVWGSTSGFGYPVFVGPGAIGALESLVATRNRVYLIADERVASLHGAAVRDRLAGVELLGESLIPPGEAEKSLATAERVLREMAAAGMRRNDTVIALGGGVVGDLAGFCAATYQRGVEVIQIPTTLVAQVDSSYGGKTGVDLPEGKNYVGSFHQPSAVVTDTSLLSSLPPAEVAAGYAEVVKTALLAGGALWRDVEISGSLLDAIASSTVQGLVEGCLRTKLAIVAADETDHGIRASLNLGHTFAHALESATGYTQFRHGEAVGLGLLVALRLSEHGLGLEPAIRKKVSELMSTNALPLTFEGPDSSELLRHADRDKKRLGSGRNLVLLRAPGDAVLNCEVDDAAIAGAIDEIRDPGAP